jgi:hypothetical protein
MLQRVLSDHAHCIIPLDNRALQSFSTLENAKMKKQDEIESPGSKHSKASGFNDMNDVAARMLCHLTSSSRFHGEMNVSYV